MNPKKLVAQYNRARCRYNGALDDLAKAEAELFKPGLVVQWEHGAYLRCGEVLRHIPGILLEGRVRVISAANKQQDVPCSRIILSKLDITHAE